MNLNQYISSKHINIYKIRYRRGARSRGVGEGDVTGGGRRERARGHLRLPYRHVTYTKVNVKKYDSCGFDSYLGNFSILHCGKKTNRGVTFYHSKRNVSKSVWAVWLPLALLFFLNSVK